MGGSGSQVATLQAAAKSQWPGPRPGAGILPSHSPPTLQEQLMWTTQGVLELPKCSQKCPLVTSSGTLMRPEGHPD
ncbi:hypothetical protein NQZ68_008060, partial [Dissostichus eleginoides]